MNKVKFVLFLLTLLVFGCAHSPNVSSSQEFFKEQKLYDSIVQIENDIHYKKCVKKDDKMKCKEITKDFSAGSGFAIAKEGVKYTSQIGTAGHVCNISSIRKTKLKLAGMANGFLVKDIYLTNIEIIDDSRN